MKKVILSLSAVIFILPVIMTAVIALLSENNTITLQNFKDLLFNCFIFYPMFWNSILYAVVITVIQLIVIIPSAFGFALAKFRGKGLLFLFYIVLMMMPLQVTILPNYIGLRDLGLIYTRWGIILPAIFSPFGIVVMRQYMHGINNSIIEAMRIETSSIVRIILSAVIPQMKICILAVVFFVFAESWNMLEQPLLFLKDDNLRTLPTLIGSAEKYAGNILFPAALVFIIPILLLYNFFSDSLEKGLTFGIKS